MLQKLVFTALALLFNTIMYAQLKEGNKMVGVTVGSAFFNTGTTDFSSAIGSSSTSNDNFGVSLSPSIGWVTSPNIIIGVMPSIGYNKQKQLGKSSSGSTYLKNENNQFSFGLGGFVRYYFDGSSQATRFFGQYNLGLGISSTKSEGFEYERLGVYVDRYNRKSSGDFFANTGVSLGVSKFLSPNTALDFSIGYNFSYRKSNPTGTTLRDYSDPGTGDETQKLDFDEKVSTHNIVLAVGFQIFLEKKK